MRVLLAVVSVLSSLEKLRTYRGIIVCRKISKRLIIRNILSNVIFLKKRFENVIILF